MGDRRKRTGVIAIVVALLILGAAYFLLSDRLANERVSQEETLAWERSFLRDTIDSFEELCQSSNTIVKAKFVSREEDFNSTIGVFRFRLEEDFIGNVDDKFLHVYEGTEASYIKGKSYYLFLCGNHFATYPHACYSRNAKFFLVGEAEYNGEIRYTFAGNQTFGLEEVTDLSEYIRTEMIAEGHYASEERESFEEAVQNADAIWRVRVLETTPVHKYITDCKYVVTEKLRERHESNVVTEEMLADAEDSLYEIRLKQCRTTMGPADAEVGDEFILLQRYVETDGEDYYTWYSPEHYIYEVSSKEARRILKMVEME